MPIKYYYEDIEQKTGKSRSTIKRWRIKIEKLAGYEFEQKYVRTSRRTYNWVYVFTEEELHKFLLLADELDVGKKLDSSVKKVWGDLNAQLERDLGQELSRLQTLVDSYVQEMNKRIEALNKVNVRLSQRVNALEEANRKLEEEKSKGFFHFRR
ncbi:hypothetical protein [Streptococcus suis]|uniref:hypothetical protein n=1 Tax=Streptococcus suis TaxID=1307 RepID=UPI001ABDF26A|nr:hypothetical protein [Streptococcus suis]